MNQSFAYGDCVRVTDDDSPFYDWVGRVRSVTPLKRSPLRPVYRAVIASSSTSEPKLRLTFRGNQLARVLDQSEISSLRHAFPLAGD